MRASLYAMSTLADCPTIKEQNTKINRSATLKRWETSSEIITAKNLIRLQQPWELSTWELL